jgi:hypothetical protein
MRVCGKKGDVGVGTQYYQCLKFPFSPARLSTRYACGISLLVRLALLHNPREWQRGRPRQQIKADATDTMAGRFTAKWLDLSPPSPRQTTESSGTRKHSCDDVTHTPRWRRSACFTLTAITSLVLWGPVGSPVCSVKNGHQMELVSRKWPTKTEYVPSPRIVASIHHTYNIPTCWG